jgi:capsular polysaccharide biosynthesis protein
MNWIVDEPVDDFEPDTPPGPITSLREILATSRRRWRTLATLGLAGMLLGAGWAMTVPAPDRASVTLLLAHPTGIDPDAAMATDISMLRTRTMAEQVISELDLSMTPSQLQDAISATPTTATVLELTVQSEVDGLALDIAQALSARYLAFRGGQLSAQAKALQDGYQERVDALEQQVQGLSKQYTGLSRGTADERALATDVLTLRSQLTSQITTLQQSIEESRIGTTSVIRASHVLDPARTLARKTGRRVALTAASGLVGGLAIGGVVVIVPTLLSTRLRRREDIARALQAAVLSSAPRVRGRRPLDRGRTVLAAGVRAACRDIDGGDRIDLAVGTVDEAGWGPDVVAEAAAGLAGIGRSVLVVDLSTKGGMSAAVDRVRAHGTDSVPLVFRPKGPFPELTRGPLRGRGRSELDEVTRTAWQEADVVLTFAPLELDAGIDELATWSSDIVVLVTAGRTGAERLGSLGDLVRSAGLDLRGAILVGTDRTDETLGRRTGAAEPEGRRATS